MENIRINFLDSKTETEKTVEVTGEYVFTHIFARLLPNNDYPVTALAGDGLYLVYFLDLRDCGYNGDIPLPGHVVYGAFEDEDKSIISMFLQMSMSVKASLEKLPAAQREAVILHYFHQFTASEIARMTNTPLPTVKSRLRAARNTLSDKLREDFE